VARFLGAACGGVLVLSSAKIGTSSWRYYTDGVACAATEYYLGVGEAPGRWHGRRLAELGLEPGARVAERELEALFSRGLHPGSGERLGRAWRADAVTGFDLTFSALKSVSALWALGNADAATAAMAAHQAAVEAGLGYLDTHAGLSRRGTDGVEQVGTAGVAVALFDHRTSRAGDPQIHTHALVVNKVRCVDGVWRTVDATELFHHKKSAGMIYQAALRSEMQRRLGVVFGEVTEHGQAEIVGVPEKLLSLWSKRTAQIEEEAGPKIAEYEKLLGRSLTAAERVGVVKTAVLKTRPGKEQHELSALHEHWTTEAQQAGFSSDQVLTSVRAAAARARVDSASRHDDAAVRTPAGPAATFTESLAGPADDDRETRLGTASVGPGGTPVVAAEPTAGELMWGFAAVRAAGQRRAVFSRADVAGHVAALMPASGLTAGEVLGEVERITSLALGLSETVPVGEQPRGVTARTSDAGFATQQVLQAEARVLSLAGRGRRGSYGRVSLPDLMPHARALGLDVGQYQAVLELAGNGDFLSVLTAPAGAGKTRTLGAAAAAWEHAGYRVVGLAPSARAAAELADATGGHTDTLAKWLHTRDRLLQIPVGAPERAWAGLDDRTVLILDEASMASTLDLDQLVTAAAAHAAKVVLVGDPAQIGVVNGPGGMLAALVHTGHASSLDRIHRFTHPWERQASLGLRTGDQTVLADYQAEGRLHPCPDSDSALDGVFSHWTQARQAGQDALMLARTRVDVDALNTRARTAAVTGGQVTGPTITTGDGTVWQEGDLLRTRRNNRSLPLGDSHVRNGDRFRVLGPGPKGSAGEQGVIVEDLAGRGRTVLPADYLAEHCEYGWASTIDAAQGATADVGIVLVRPGMDREHLYVAMTRGRHSNHLYLTPDPSREVGCDHGHGHLAATPGATSGNGARAIPPGQGPMADQPALRVLETALATSGAQDAAHTALATARAAAIKAARQDATIKAARDAITRAQQSEAARTPTPAHTVDQQRLRALQEQREQLTRQHHDTARAGQQAREELQGSPRWARSLRRELTAVLSQVDEQRQQQPTQLAHLDTQISHVQQRLDADNQERDARRTADPLTAARRAATAPDPLGKLTPPSRLTGPPTIRPGTRPIGRPAGWPTRPALDSQVRASSRSTLTAPQGPNEYPGPGHDAGRSR